MCCLKIVKYIVLQAKKFNGNQSSSWHSKLRGTVKQGLLLNTEELGQKAFERGDMWEFP